MIAGSARPSDAARIAKVVAPRPLMPAARPSMPSVKLIMFTRATNHSTVSGYWAGPRSPTPRNGRVTWSIVSPADTGIAAHATWPTSFTAGESPQMSSTAPRAAIRIAPVMSARAAWSAGK